MSEACVRSRSRVLLPRCWGKWCSLTCSHAVQLDAPVPLATVPASQSMQLGWPVANWCFPAEQSLQDVNPVVLATVPAAQAEQLLAPVASL